MTKSGFMPGTRSDGGLMQIRITIKTRPGWVNGG
jgi:hypothetical protein